MSRLRTYLEQDVARWRQLGHPHLIEEFVLRHGQLYTAAPLPPELEERRGELRQCYSNCSEAVLAMVIEGWEYYAYAEGFAQGLALPAVHHAWVTDGEYAYDLTWDYVEGREYFGTAFDITWLEEWWQLNEHYGVLGLGDGFATKHQQRLVEEGLPDVALWPG